MHRDRTERGPCHRLRATAPALTRACVRAVRRRVLCRYRGRHRGREHQHRLRLSAAWILGAVPGPPGARVCGGGATSHGRDADTAGRQLLDGHGLEGVARPADPSPEHAACVGIQPHRRLGTVWCVRSTEASGARAPSYLQLCIERDGTGGLCELRWQMSMHAKLPWPFLSSYQTSLPCTPTRVYLLHCCCLQRWWICVRLRAGSR